MSNIVFYDIKEARFEIYGLYDVYSGNGYRRIPEDVARATSSEVHRLHVHTAGGRVRFSTDSDRIYIRAKVDGEGPLYHVTPFMQHGFDIYIDSQKGSKYIGGLCPVWDDDIDKQQGFTLPVGMKEITVNMPLFGSVYECEIGLCENAVIKAHSPYVNELPVVFYGSSITQGACVSRPGRGYEAMISRKYNLNFTNLGFSGSCRAEDAIVDHISTLPMSAFVSDYDHNASNPEYLKNTHFKMYQKIRSKHPDIPYFMITRPNFHFNDDCQARRAVIMESYVRAYDSGDRNVYFIDGSAFFSRKDVDDLTLDLVHPNDEGAARMADYIGDVIAHVMKL